MTGFGIILFEPLLPWWVMAVCFVVFGILAWGTYSRCTISLWKRLFLFSLRIAAFMILCWILLQPIHRSLEVVDEKASLLVVVDETASMEDSLPGVTKNRGAVAREILGSEEMAKLQRRYNVLPFRVGVGLKRGLGSEEEGGLTFTGGESQLLAGLQELRLATKAERPFAVMFLTDGLDTRGLGLNYEGLLPDIPFIIPELEDAKQVKVDTTFEYGVDLPDNKGVRRVVKGWKTSVRVNVNRLHGKGAGKVSAVLSYKGRDLEVREVTFDETSRYAQTTFELLPDALGNQSYRVTIRPDSDMDETNNVSDFVLEVTDEENRVLYLEGLLRPDFKFLKRALQKERHFQTSVYLRMGNGVFMNFEDEVEGRSELGSLLTEENLKRYKVLVLGEFTEDSFTDAQVAAVVSFVERGGGVLFAGASRAYGEGGYLADKRFGNLSPVSSDAGASMVEGKAFALNFTASGRNDSAFMKLASEASFSTLQSLWQPVTLSEGATSILETGDGSPVLAVRRYGEGRVCTFLSNTLYSLRLKGGGQDTVNVYDRLVSQTIFWMLPDVKDTSGGDSLQILVKDDGVDVNQKVYVGALSGRGEKAGNLQCQVTWPDGKTVSYPMQATTLEHQVGLSNGKNGFLSEFKATAVGTYQMEIVRQDGLRSGRKLLVVRRPMLEMTGEPINREFLKRLAEEHGGKFVPYGVMSGWLDGIAVPERRKEILEEATQWDSWFWLIPLMALFCVEWYARRRWDLV